MAQLELTRTHRILIGVVITGAVIIAGIGFAGSYSAVRALALQKGFGSFSLVFPIGIDAGICVLLALDLLLTWLRIPFPLLRQTAWLLTSATIAFNGAAAWPDPLGVGMHAVIPILFVVTVEAARHAVGRIADITADRHMEGVRLTRWILSPVPTFKLWRRMKLWELRSYEQAVGMEQDRLIYQARLQARYGRAWRRKAPVEALMPLRLARIGVPLAQTAPDGLAAAGIDPVLRPSLPQPGEAQPVAPPVVQAASAAPALAVGPVPQAARSTGPSIGDEVDMVAAGRLFIERNGALPRAEEFAAFLARDFGVTDPGTGQLVAGDILEPVLAELAQARRETDPAPMEHEPAADMNRATANSRMTEAMAPADAGPRPFLEQPAAQLAAAPASASADRQPAPLSTAAADMPSPRRTMPAPATAESLEPGLLGPGTATAALPKQQTAELELDPVQQQTLTVAQWLAEAENTGGKLSGAEVGRRLGVSPRTGQRRLDKAAEHLAEQRRQQGRAHLRSVRT
ncbi:DUF2637 domain-containing protein [Streptomyces sp. NBC_01568]|uniref:DUF2637 domain-containing protein n=1 Tax=Streptomyces sp. NBC_01568 TaxID=2975882 RepID=UPI00386ECB64